jgi:hypothetical protein
MPFTLGGSRFALAPREAVRFPPIMSLGVRLRRADRAAVEFGAWIASERASSSRVKTSYIRDAGQGRQTVVHLICARRNRWIPLTPTCVAKILIFATRGAGVS